MLNRLLKHSCIPIVGLCASLWLDNELNAATIELLRDGDTIAVTIDGDLFTRYLPLSGTKPILWPLMAQGGVPLTRGYPMVEGVDNEPTDHPHHRSIWFTHGDVNGIDFWLEPDGNANRGRGLGHIVHRRFLKIEGGDQPTIIAQCEWMNSEEETQLVEYRTMMFGSNENHRWIDFDIQLFAPDRGPVKFGDTKEGTFGVRVASWMTADAGGRIVNNLGVTGKDVWGKAASWVDYHGEHEGQKFGIAILNHPSSFHFPTFWHVRTYGLFAANVFGIHNFKNSDDEDGSFQLESGESLLFCYRVLVHLGDEQAGRVPEAFIDYAKVDKVSKSKADFDALDLEPLRAAEQATAK